MSVSAATLKMMAEFGLTLDQILALSERIDADHAPAQSTGAVRQRAYRERKASQSDVTRDVTSDVTKGPSLPPKEYIQTPHPSTNSEANASAPVDPVAVAFAAGKLLLGQAGVKNPGGILGRWRRDNGDEALIAALGRCQREGAIDPVAFIEGCFRARRRHEAHQDEMAVPC